MEDAKEISEERALDTNISWKELTSDEIENITRELEAFPLRPFPLRFY